MKTLLIILYLFACMLLKSNAQPTITPAFAFGTYQHYTTDKHQMNAMLNISSGYMFALKNTGIKPLAEISTLIPLMNNDHPLSFALQAGAFFPLTEKLAFLVAAGPEIHIQELYKYPLDGKDGPDFPQRKRVQPSGKLRIMKQFQDDVVTKVFTEFSYDQMMPLIKFGLFITIIKKS